MALPSPHPRQHCDYTISIQCLPSLSPMAMSPHGEPPRWTWEEKTYHALSLMIKYDTIVGWWPVREEKTYHALTHDPPQNIPPKKFHQKHQENDEFAQFSLSSCIIKSMRFNQMFKVSFISTAKNDVESKKANASYFFTSKSSSLGHHLSSASSLASSSFTSAPSSLPSYSSSSPCGFELLSCTHSDLSRFYGSTC